MTLGLNLPADEKYRLDDLLRLNRFDLKMLYWSLPTPTIADVDGEYDAQLLHQGDPIGSLMTRLCFGSKGAWIGKAFRPISADSGEGYNAFGSIEGRQPLLPMDTYIGHSQIIPGLSFILDYKNKNRGPIRWLVGELRPVSGSILLGIGTFGPRGPRLARLRRVIPFVLVRSDREYISHLQAA